MIRFSCPYCRERLRFPRGAPSLSTSCPNCGKAVSVPNRFSTSFTQLALLVVGWFLIIVGVPAAIAGAGLAMPVGGILCLAAGALLGAVERLTWSLNSWGRAFWESRSGPPE